jgi:hypothetical protein
MTTLNKQLICTTLNCDLLEFIEKRGSSYFIRNRLVNTQIFNAPMIKEINDQFTYKSNELEKAVFEKNWSKVISLHERPFRLKALIDYKDSMSDEAYWESVAEVFIDSETIFKNLSSWRDIFGSTRNNSQFFMDVSDQKTFRQLPESINLYRGCIDGKNKFGFSYSLSKEKAHWFATRFNHPNSLVVERSVTRHQCFASCICT